MGCIILPSWPLVRFRPKLTGHIGKVIHFGGRVKVGSETLKDSNCCLLFIWVPRILRSGTHPQCWQLWLFYRPEHSSPESGPNPKVNNHPESIWNMVWLFMPVEKNLFRKFFIGGPSRKFKNLAKKLSDFDEILTSKSTQMVFWVVKFLSKSDNFLAKFLNFLKGPSVEYLILLFFELTHMYVKQKQRRFSGALTLELGPISGELCGIMFLPLCYHFLQILSLRGHWGWWYFRFDLRSSWGCRPQRGRTGT